MAARRQHSPHKRTRIAVMYNLGTSARVIAAQEGISAGSVRGIASRYASQISAADRSRSGRPPILSERDKRAILRCIARNPFTTACQIVRDTKIACAPVTISRYLKDQGVYLKRPSRVSAATQMETTPKQSFTIHHVQSEDVPALAQLSADAFESDRQTAMKGLGKDPYDMKAVSLASLSQMLRSPRKCVVLKAVDTASGEIMGYCSWGFRGLEPDERPFLEGAEGALAHSSPPAGSEAKPSPSSPPDPGPGTEPSADPIRRLEALTNADMGAWMAEVMPEGTRCLYVIGLSVAPKHQGRGVGSALLRWGTRACDERRVFAWAQSSEPAWKMYEKCGFQTIRSLDVNLDEYAPMPPPNEGPGAKWGHYVFRYMKYLPREDETGGEGRIART